MRGMTRVEINVSGRVQGVGFRYYVHNRIQKYDITGYIQNLPNGSVKAVFEGKIADVQAAVAICKIGPATANISDHTEMHCDYSGEFTTFQIR